MNDIYLKNGKIATYSSTRTSIIKDIDPVNPTEIHIYNTPCPVCDSINPAYSHDGLSFVSFQITCRSCGIFFRPISDYGKTYQLFHGG